MVMGYLAGSEHGLAAETSLALITGAIALDVHAVKATSRVAINASPEPLSNITVSATEDVSVGLMFVLFFQHPWIASIIVILTLIGSFFFLRMMWHLAKKLFKKKAPLEQAHK
jgi:hypothetical protein